MSIDNWKVEENSPNRWPSVTLGSLVTLVNGRGFRSREIIKDSSDKGLPIIRIGNLNNPEAKFDYYYGQYEEKHFVKSGDLLFSWSGSKGTSFGAHIWRGSHGLIKQHIYKVNR